jgi:hypothetical protein
LFNNNIFLQLTPSGQPIKVEDEKPSPGTLPKFQFAFGGRDSNPTIKTEPGLVVVKSEPGEPSNGKLVLTSSAQTSQKGQNLIGLQSSKSASQIVVPVGSVSSLQSPILSNQVENSFIYICCVKGSKHKDKQTKHFFLHLIYVLFVLLPFRHFATYKIKLVIVPQLIA